MLTQADLLEQLDRCRRPKTPRGLTDWRAKGFLPRMVQRGAGRGRGASFVWIEPDILDRAILVDDLLAGGLRGEQVVLCSWFAGHEVDSATVRKAWLARLASATERALPGRFYEFEDMLGAMSCSLSRALAPQFGVAAGDLDELIFELLNVFYQRSYRFDVRDNTGFVEKLNEIAVRAGNNEPGISVVTNSMLEQYFEFIRDRLSIASRERLLESVSDEDLSDAHRRWRLSLSCARNLIESSGAGESDDSIRDLVRRLSVTAGPWGILGLLHLARPPYASCLAEAERALEKAANSTLEETLAALVEAWTGAS